MSVPFREVLMRTMRGRTAEITRLRAEVERLKIENIQMQAALGYGILAEYERHILPSNPFKCGTCDASKHLRAENERLRAALREIEALEGGINPSNYSHDDVLALNNSFCEAFDIAHATLDTQPAPKEDRT